MISRAMRSRMLLLAFSACLCSGCGSSEPLTFFQKLADTQANHLVILESIVDAQSATEQLPALEKSMTTLLETAVEMTKYGETARVAKSEKESFLNLTKVIQEQTKKTERETERIENLTNLPVGFWNTYRVLSMEQVIAVIEAHQGATVSQNEAMQDLYEIRRLFEEHGPEKLVEIDLKNLPESLHQAVMDRVSALGNSKWDVILLYVPTQQSNTCNLAVSPVEDYEALVNAIDFGEIQSKNPSRRYFSIEVDRRKLGARANSDAEERKLGFAENQASSQRFEQEIEASRQQVDQHFEELEAKRRGPQPGDENYHQKLAQHLMDSQSDHYDRAIDTFLNMSKSEVTDTEARKAIARGFREIAYEHKFKQSEGIRGLVRWGGKFSVPLLIELLEREKFAADDELYSALAQVNDPRCAEAVARKLGDFFSHKKAVSCLRKMGSVAEDALIQVAPSDDENVSLVAVTLLGDAGSPKSYDLLRQAIKSRNRNVKEAAKQSLKKIRLREKAKPE